METEKEHGIQIKLNDKKKYTLYLDGEEKGEFDDIPGAFDTGNAMLSRLLEEERKKHKQVFA